MMITPFDTSNLLSGAVGALLGSAVAGGVAWVVQRDTKGWTLRAELRRYEVSRIAAAVEGLRVCYYQALTELQYHQLELQGLEAALASPYPMADLVHNLVGPEAIPERAMAEFERLRQATTNERHRYNAVVSQTESRAKAHVEALVSRVVPLDLLGRIRAELEVLTAGHTTDSASVQVRIDLFAMHHASVMSLLRHVDELNQNEITKDI